MRGEEIATYFFGAERPIFAVGLSCDGEELRKEFLILVYLGDG